MNPHTITLQFPVTVFSAPGEVIRTADGDITYRQWLVRERVRLLKKDCDAEIIQLATSGWIALCYVVARSSAGSVCDSYPVITHEEMRKLFLNEPVEKSV